MSHVHAFSCIRIFNSIYLDISIVWYFFDCLCFFLSFSSSYFSCVMAPKHKSTSSQNPLRFEASSSSSHFDLSPFHVWFCDEKAKTDFFESFSRCDIHLEHQVVLLDFSNIDLPTIIYSRGCESLCGALVTCLSVIIQEFYSNVHRFDYSIPSFLLAFGVYAL